MKKSITDLNNLLSADPRLNTDGADTIAVKTFCKYEDPLIPEFPAVSLKRIRKTKQIKTVSLGYMETFSIEIICHVQELEMSDGGKSMIGFDNLDKLTGIVESIIQAKPKINGDYHNSEITGTDYQAYDDGNYLNYRAVISVDLIRRKSYA